MKKILFVSLFLTVPLLSFNQDLNFEETLSYINDKLANECAGSDGNPFRNSYYQLEISKEGLLKIKYFWEDDTYVYHTDGYIKNLIVKEDLESGLSGYNIILKCKSESCLTKIDVRSKGEVEILGKTSIYGIGNHEVAKKLLKAIKHLFILAERKEQFYERDPFSN